MYKEKSVGTDI